MRMKKILLACCLIWMTKAQQQCRTVNTQQTCIFPFTFQGISYNGCTFAGNSNTPWCALDSRATKWEDCEASCPIANGGNGNVANRQDCSCGDFMNTNGYGQCKKGNSRFGGAVTCYVNLPSTCTDRRESGSNPGKWSSSEACRINSGWTKWGNWGQCSGACGVGNGVENRRRTCQGGWGYCNGDGIEARSCTTLDRCIGNNGNQDPCTLDRSNCIGNNGNNINNGNNGNNGNTNRDCYTTGGPQRNQLCVFPFFHGSLQYHDCTRAGHKEGKLWCSTKVDSTGRHIDGQGFFGTCSGRCFGNAAGANSQVWNNWSNWGQCSGGNGGNNGGDNGVSERRRACKGTNCRGKTVETRSCSNSVGSGASGRCVTNSGPAAGQPCVFPFKYDRKTHTSCGVWKWRGPNQGKRWCSTRTKSNGNHISKSGNYGFCPNTPICNGNGGGNNGNGGGNNGNGGGNSAPQVGNSGGFVIKNANVGSRNLGQEDQDVDEAPQ